MLESVTVTKLNPGYKEFHVSALTTLRKSTSADARFRDQIGGQDEAF